ncbi:MAG: CbtA family protein [Saccharospirillaceae bacterium]|nr:CbtA family protein [Pseudomonadales bacterium]NRB79719.1 CbtA family protein [Saccharospirillaceae bacterium]
MLFRSIIFSAIPAALVSGLILSLFQIILLNPIILAAEQFEVTDSQVDHHAHSHSHSTNQTATVVETHNDIVNDNHNSQEPEWEPANLTQRQLFSLLTNVITAFGFSVMMIALMAQIQSKRSSNLTIVKRLIWGAAGFATFFAIPAMGMSPEIPGMQAADLSSRQLWWSFTVICSGAGLFIVFFAPLKFKLVSVLLLLAPFIVGVPGFEGLEFLQEDVETLTILNNLHHKFIYLTVIANAVFWLVIGLTGGFAVQRESFKKLLS